MDFNKVKRDALTAISRDLARTRVDARYYTHGVMIRVVDIYSEEFNRNRNDTHVCKLCIFGCGIKNSDSRRCVLSSPYPCEVSEREDGVDVAFQKVRAWKND